MRALLAPPPLQLLRQLNRQWALATIGRRVFVDGVWRGRPLDATAERSRKAAVHQVPFTEGDKGEG